MGRIYIKLAVKGLVCHKSTAEEACIFDLREQRNEQLITLSFNTLKLDITQTINHSFRAQCSLSC